MRSGGERERKKKSRERERKKKRVCDERGFCSLFYIFFPVENHSVSYFDPNVVNKSSSITSSNE